MGSEQKRAILAVVISGAILLSWQYFFPATPVQSKKPQEVKTVHITETDKTEKNIETSQDNSNLKSLSKFELKNDNYFYSLTSNLSVRDVESKLFNLSLKEVFHAQKNGIFFKVDGQYQQFSFKINKISDSRVEIANSALDINGSITLEENGFLVVNLDSDKAFNYKFQFSQQEEELSGGKLKQFILFGEDLDTVDVGSDDSGDKTLKWFGLDFNYHIFTIVTEKGPKVYKVTESGVMDLVDTRPVSKLSYKVMFAKKDYDRLVSLGNNLNLSVDFGFFSILATPILRGLQFFYGLIPNYGVAIIIVTILMRLLTFPLQYKSFKSMKKMQEVQPELAKIKERYKEDPQRMQKETMALFKKAGANPIGGCLPMILQMPIFFAFYRVLYNAVELVDAPFILWIHDLSSKDPYYVLPILMAAAMFFHQKLTPSTTVDPTQKKIMMFMPVIFALFMKDFPAGLTLYIFVSTMVAMLQQVLVYRKS